MNKYICTEGFFIDNYDDGEYDDSTMESINKYEIFNDVTDDVTLLIAAPPARRLENNKHWIEIQPGTLEKYFKKI